MLGLLVTVGAAWPAPSASAITKIPDPPPSGGSYGLEATKKQPAPTTAAHITSPSGGSFSTSPITVSGLCTRGLLVQVYNNGVLAGAVDCANGSFQLQVSLFTGKNVLNALQFDNLGQSGPDSNHVTVTYNNAHFAAFGELITLTSDYGRRSANPGSTLTWPLLLSGGTGPYAFSIDWGDGKDPELMSQELAGQITIKHVYDQSGIYHVLIRVTDSNGITAFLQVVAVANGKPVGGGSTGKDEGGTIVITRIIWIPALICLLLLPVAYWLGRRSELVSIRKKLERDMSNYNEL
jgi:hypothetical protein